MENSIKDGFATVLLAFCAVAYLANIVLMFMEDSKWLVFARFIGVIIPPLGVLLGGLI